MTTKEALDGSIKKWEKIVSGVGSDLGSTNCPLCNLFVEENCFGCPVREYTGYIFCDGSPYDDWRDYETDTIYDYKGKINPEALKAAQAELDFLKMLKNKMEKQNGN